MKRRNFEKKRIILSQKTYLIKKKKILLHENEHFQSKNIKKDNRRNITCKLTLIVPKKSLQSEMRCSSQTERLYIAHICFFILLPIAEPASLPRRQLPSLKSAWRRSSRT